MSTILCDIIVFTMDPEQKENRSLFRSLWELLRFIIIALLIVIPIRVFIIEPFVVSGSSMFPTFHNGDYLIVDKLSYEVGGPSRDDVVIFRYPKDPSKYFIKRIVGLPGETVDIKGGVVTITNADNKEGFILDEPFVKNNSGSEAHLELQSDEYFVMGDNRNASSDSRYWGPVKRNLIVGRAFLRLLPINDIGVLPGKYSQAEK